MPVLTLEEAKMQCRIEPEITDDDLHLETLIQAAHSAIESDLAKTLVDADPQDGQQIINASIKMAAKLLVAHWYSNREAVIVGSVATSLPLGYDSLLQPFRDVLVG